MKTELKSVGKFIKFIFFPEVLNKKEKKWLVTSKYRDFVQFQFYSYNKVYSPASLI